MFSNKNTVTLSSPWQIFYRQIEALFGSDRDIKIFFDESETTIKLYVENNEKAEAIRALLPEQKKFGSVTIKIDIIPANGVVNKDFGKKLTVDSFLFNAAFDSNPAYNFSKTFVGVFTNPITYVVFENKVVQYYSDNLGDLHGLTSTLFQNIAEEILIAEGVCYSTNCRFDAKDDAKDVEFRF